MPSWLLLPLVLLGFSAVVPLFVLAMSGGKWREAIKAWGQYGKVMAALALPGALAALAYLIWPPHP